MYGGNGKATFALPDLRDRVIVGSSTSLSVGQQLGSSLVTLTVDQMPTHTHTLQS